jgi:hypothetical protein
MPSARRWWHQVSTLIRASSRRKRKIDWQCAYIVAYIELVPVEIRGQRFFKSSEVARLAGVHRLTLLRWIREGRLADVSRDRNGWRVFSEQETAAIVDFAKSFDVRTSPNQGLLFPSELQRTPNQFAKAKAKP